MKEKSKMAMLAILLLVLFIAVGRVHADGNESNNSTSGNNDDDNEDDDSNDDSSSDDSLNETSDDDDSDDSLEVEDEDEEEDEDDDNSSRSGFGIGRAMHELTEKDKGELKVMCEPYGAQVRMLQLQKQIQANLLKGEKILDLLESGNYTLNNTNLSNKIDGLEDILDKMEVLIEEIQDTNFTNKTQEQLAADFVDIKEEATDLTKEFR